MEELTIRKQSRELYALAGGNKQFLMLCNWLSASKVRVSANIIQDWPLVVIHIQTINVQSPYIIVTEAYDNLWFLLVLHTLCLLAQQDPQGLTIPTS